MVYMYHSFLIHSSADGHLGCFHVLAIINSAERDTCTPMFIAGQTFFNKGVLQIKLAKENLVGSCVPLLLRGRVVTEAIGTTKPKIFVTWPLKLCLLFLMVLHREKSEL